MEDGILIDSKIHKKAENYIVNVKEDIDDRKRSLSERLR